MERIFLGCVDFYDRQLPPNFALQPPGALNIMGAPAGERGR